MPAAPLSLLSVQSTAPAVAPGGRASQLPVALMRQGLITGDQMVQALNIQARRGGRLVDVLIARNLVPRDTLYEALARHWNTRVLSLAEERPDVRLIDRLGATACLHHQLLPICHAGGLTVIATARPEDFAARRPWLEEKFGPCLMVIARPEAIEAALLRLRGHGLAHLAEQRVPPALSCRNLTGSRMFWPLASGLVGTLILSLIFPMFMLWLAFGWTLLTMTAVTLLKIAAVATEALPQPAEAPEPPVIARLPVVSVMVALYREASIAPRLIRRLARLDYPQELLDIVLVVEAEDSLTRNALAATDLPPWMRVVVVPDGRLKTKPRALNFALDHCRGSIVGVYDAEDAPEPDQIRKVVERFHSRGPEVVCLQGVLDFYNPRTNWLSRCFTIEYATWFRLILPGIQRLGLPVPLGGTTLFFRRKAIEELGGWDAHNVTEDADLGIRLARMGYRTELIDTTTHEEANCRALPWVKQRSRWLKGYMMTYASHMRAPRLLWRQLGAWQFIGFQILFIGSLSQFVLAPVIGFFGIGLLGVDHPIFAALPRPAYLMLITIFVVTELANLWFNWFAMRRTRHRLNPLWIPTLHIYFPLGSLASYKAIWELLRKPFYWDKTTHGEFDSTGG